MAAKPKAAPSPSPTPSATKKKRRSPFGPILILLPLLLLGGAYGLAKIGVLPVAKWTAKKPALRKLVLAAGLGPKKPKTAAAETAKTTDEHAAAAPPATPTPAPEPEPKPEATAETPETPEPTPTATATPAAPPVDNSAKVVKILATMEPSAVAQMFTKMPDAEVAPLMLKMKEGMAGEVLAALPPTRAVTLTRYLRRYQLGAATGASPLDTASTPKL